MIAEDFILYILSVIVGGFAVLKEKESLHKEFPKRTYRVIVAFTAIFMLPLAFTIALFVKVWRAIK